MGAKQSYTKVCFCNSKQVSIFKTSNMTKCVLCRMCGRRLCNEETLCPYIHSYILLCSKWIHIAPKAQVTSDKNAHKRWHHFQAQFLMLFHLVLFILFRVIASGTAFSLVGIIQQPIGNFHFEVFKANTPNKMDHTMLKSMESCVSEIVRTFVCGHLSLWKDVN